MGEIVGSDKTTLRIAALPFSSGTGPLGIEAEVASVGHGAESDFAKPRTNLRGRWALVTTEPMRKIEDLDAEYLMAPRIFESARRAGAVGVLWMSTHSGRLLYRHPVGFDDVVNSLPGAMLEREDALRIGRTLEAGRPVRIRIVTIPRIIKGAQSANIVGEIRGAEKADEYVVLGAHIDSWDLGQGSLDNGCNTALVVDAARQIAAVSNTYRDSTVGR